MGLPLAGDADVDEHHAARVDLDLRALERADARALDVGAHADADRPRATAASGLLPAPPRVVEPPQGLVEGGDVVAGVVDDGHAVPVGEPGRERHLVRPHEVAAPELRRVQPDAPRGAIEEAVEHERGLGAAGAAVGRVEGLVGDHVVPDGAVAGHAVRPDEVVDRVPGDRVAEGRIRAVVADEGGLEGHDGPVAGHAQPSLMRLVAVAGGGQQMLAARLDPPDGPTEPPRHRRHHHLLRIHVALDAEAAPHVGGDHPHRVLGETEGGRHRAPHVERHLGRRPHGEAPGPGIERGEDTAGLHGHAGDARVVQARLDDGVGRGEPARHVAHRAPGRAREVVRPSLVHQGRAPGGRKHGKRRHRERLVVHAHAGRPRRPPRTDPRPPPAPPPLRRDGRGHRP